MQQIHEKQLHVLLKGEVCGSVRKNSPTKKFEN